MALCSNCGLKEEVKTSTSRKSWIIEGWCHTCMFWQEVADSIKNGYEDKKITPDYTVYNFNAYVVKPALGQMLGHSGHLWRIVQEDKVLITNDLWYNGVVPDHFKSNPYLQPNCVVEQDVSVEEVEHTLNMYHCSNCGSYHNHGESCDYKPPILKRTTRSIEELEEDHPF